MLASAIDESPRFSYQPFPCSNARECFEQKGFQPVKLRVVLLRVDAIPEMLPAFRPARNRRATVYKFQRISRVFR
jgi:hypothetical protein